MGSARPACGFSVPAADERLESFSTSTLHPTRLCCPTFSVAPATDLSTSRRIVAVIAGIAKRLVL